MKPITLNIKTKVVKLFLGGYSYDEIAQQVGIAKGSVVNIIDEFREGSLPLPPGMTEYVDELRHLVVDLKKHQTSVSQAKSYLKLHARLQDMGVNSEEVEQWLDVCQSIASPTASNAQFVKAALELAELESMNGSSYESLLDDYQEKAKTLQKLDAGIEKRSAELDQVSLNLKQEKEQATKELDSITKAIATAQDTFSQQKKGLKAQLDEHLAQNKLAWQKVKTVAALLNSGLGDAGLTKEEIKELSSQIAVAGSLAVAIKQLEQKRDEVKAKVDQLVQEKSHYAHSVDQLKALNGKVFDSLAAKGQEDLRLDAEIQSKTKKLDSLNQTMAETTAQMASMVRDMYMAQLILAFLAAPNALSDSRLNDLVSLMVAVRQQRLGFGAKQVKDASGEVICECPIPKIDQHVVLDSADIDQARQQLALYLAPLVRDKFVTRIEYEMARIDVRIAKTDAILRAKGLM